MAGAEAGASRKPVGPWELSVGTQIEWGGCDLLIRIGEGDYIGGDTFMDHGRACILLLKHEAAVWNTYDGHGQLLGATVHAAGTACGGAKLVSPKISILRRP